MLDPWLTEKEGKCLARLLNYNAAEQRHDLSIPLDLAFVIARVVLGALAGWQGLMKYGIVQESALCYLKVN